jgi:hypothetical protein
VAQAPREQERLLLWLRRLDRCFRRTSGSSEWSEARGLSRADARLGSTGYVTVIFLAGNRNLSRRGHRNSQRGADVGRLQAPTSGLSQKRSSPKLLLASDELVRGIPITRHAVETLTLKVVAAQGSLAPDSRIKPDIAQPPGNEKALLLRGLVHWATRTAAEGSR